MVVHAAERTEMAPYTKEQKALLWVFIPSILLLVVAAALVGTRSFEVLLTLLFAASMMLIFYFINSVLNNIRTRLPKNDSAILLIKVTVFTLIMILIYNFHTVVSG